MDVVITYVDINDNFLKEYNTYCTKELQENRFRSYGVLDLQVKQIRKYMPYVKNIFIVVSNEDQISQYSLPDCKIIKHSDIIPNKYLPCYNSCTIEMFLWKIPGLAEEFVYFNDDTFVIDYIHHTKWFIKGKPCLNVKENEILGTESNIYKKNCINSTALASSIVGKQYDGKYLTQSHCARPFLKSTCEKVFDKRSLDIYKSLTRLRHSRNYNATLFNDYDYFKNNYYSLENNYTFCNGSESLEELREKILVKEKHLICINDNDYCIDFDEFKRELRKSFEDNLNDKKYEKNIKKENKKIIKYLPGDKLYVSFTSWTKRIQYCKHTIELMSNQTLKPTKIILNLAEEEFPNKENDLPEELINEVKTNKLFEIYWVKENTTVWKKILPTLHRFPDDLVLSIDDDIEYPSNYIEEMYRTFIDNKKLYPVVAYKNFQNNKLYHSGPFTLTNYHFYGKYLDILYDELIYPSLKEIKWQSDNVYSEALFLNHNSYIKCNEINGKELYVSSKINKENAYSRYNTKEYVNNLTKNIEKLKKFINDRFEKIDLSNIKLIVSFTTWIKRDKYVEEMLTYLQKQTFKPYKIICWIAKDEYNGIIPDTLKTCLNKNLLDEVKWTPTNIYGHKRYEIFKEYSNYYVATIDDDLYYPVNHFQNLLEISIKNPGCACSYFSRTVNYIHGFRKENIETFKNVNIKNEIYSGLSLYPPHVFPLESFNYVKLRNKYCLKCDDSWVNAWLKKKNIKVSAFEEWHNKCLNTIDGTVEGCIWNTHNNIKINGNIIQLYYNRMTAFKCIGIDNKAKELWPDCDIDKYNFITE